MHSFSSMTSIFSSMTWSAGSGSGPVTFLFRSASGYASGIVLDYATGIAYSYVRAVVLMPRRDSAIV